MNNEYSKINFPMLKNMKRLYRTNPSGFKRAYRDESEKINSAIDVGLSPKEKNINELNVANFAMSIADGKYLNYFIEPEVFDFLNEIPLKENHDVSLLLKDKFMEENHGIITTLNSTKEAKYDCLTGIFHSPKIKYSIVFSITTVQDPFDQTYLCLSDGDTAIGITLNEKLNSDTLEIKGYSIWKMAGIIINMFYYMDAYPDAILNNPPDIVLDKLNRSNSKTIGISDEIRPFITHEMMPHLRRGHFRYLASDYYVNKKGQTVFIKPTFIHGEAKTIIKNEALNIN